MRESPLLREALAEGRVDLWAYARDGEFPYHRAQKDEAEAFVAEYVARVGQDGLSAVLAEHRPYLEETVPNLLSHASSPSDYLRLCAFAELWKLITKTQLELEVASLDPISESDFAFDGTDLFSIASKDGLMPIGRENVDPAWTGVNAAFFFDNVVLFPHPFLTLNRELLESLAALAENPGIDVSIAIDRFRSASRNDLQRRIWADLWRGKQLTKESLDSLDRSEPGEHFHAAPEAQMGHKVFDPLLGTWFSWQARNDEPADPIKRLYIQEVRPPHGSFGSAVTAVDNRELHSERDTASHSFTHVDGKICRYGIDEYPASVEKPMDKPASPLSSRKLWRVDGELTDAEWFALVNEFFRGNHLIAEHFTDAFE